MSAAIAEHPMSFAPPQRALLLIRMSAVGLVALSGGLVTQLWRHHALSGGRAARTAIPHDDIGWRWPHFVANGVSLAGGTVVAPALLLALAGVLSVRRGRWQPLVGAAAGVLLIDFCIALGKGLDGGSAVSGPAATNLVCWGTAAWLLRRCIGVSLRRALHLLAASAALIIGVSQLYLGHSYLALLASWLLGVVVLVVLALLARHCGGLVDARRSPC